MEKKLRGKKVAILVADGFEHAAEAAGDHRVDRAGCQLQVGEQGIGMLGRHRHIVEQTESHGPISLGMVARRSHQGKRRINLSSHERVDAFHSCSRPKLSCRHASRRNGRVFIQARMHSSQRLDLTNVPGVVDPLEPFRPCGMGLHPRHL